MLKYLEATGSNEENAIAAALKQLNLDRDDVSVQVLERAKSGFLGIGASPAKVRVSYEVPDEEEIAIPQEEEPQPEEPQPVVEQEPEEQTTVEEIPAEQAAAPAQEGDSKGAEIVAFLNGLMEHMHICAVAEIESVEDGVYRINLEGENLGAAIGRRGETLDAIQQLTSYSVNRGAGKRVRVHVDAEHYRAKREEALVRLATRVAEKVVRYHRNMTLEPMNAYERHVIHAALQEYPGVTTYSIGSEPNRRTVVALDR